MRQFKSRPMELNYKNNKIIIMGLGLHGGGVSSARFFAKLCCHILVTDLKKPSELAPSLQKLKKFKNIKYVLGRHRKGDFKNADLIIRNPAVPNNSEFLTIARQQKIPVHTDISWFLVNLKLGNLEIEKLKIIGITGTKGKSTTATLLHYILTKCGEKSLLCGNIRQSPLDFIKFAKSKFLISQSLNFIILELSCWHLESLAEHKLAPQIAIITNILPDHLNRYKNFTDYKKTKTLIFKYQTKNDILFLNKNNPILRQITKNTNIKPKIIWYKAGDNPSAQAALAVCKYLKLNKNSVQQAIKTFPGLEGRLEYAGAIDGVKYYNDTCATQPDATIYSIKKLKDKSEKREANIVLIAGGEDKNLDYNRLAKIIKKDIKALILFKGPASEKIIHSLKQFPNFPSSQFLKFNISSMQNAVSAAKALAKPNDIVLLSPAAASFNLFKHEFDRGAQFKQCVKKLIVQTTN